MKKFFILISLLWSIGGIGQNKSPDSLWLLKSNSSNLISDFENGYNAFYFDSITELEQKLDSFSQLLKTNQKVLLVYNKKEEWDFKFLPDSLTISNNLFDSSSAQLFLIGKNQFNQIHIDRDSLSENTICRNYNLITTDSLKDQKEIDDFLDHLMHKKGVVPDVITSPYISDIEYFKNSFEKKPIYRARVTYNGEELREVKWKEFPHLETCGVFRTSDSTLSPQKRGFMFSPDIYNFTDKNTKIAGPKTFRAIKYELDEKLRYSLPLVGDFTNLANPADKSTATDIQFKKDSKRANEVAYFNGTSGYIDIRSIPEDKLEEISISAWIKPDEIDGSFSLIGKGEAFSAKIYYGRLQFTATGIEDHATSKRVISKGEWSHIAYVYVPKQKLYFYVNGELIEEISASDMRQTDHALLIGTNLWGQYYSGFLSDLKIWDRALSDDEIASIYLKKDDKDETGFELSQSWAWISGLFLGLLLIGVFVFNKKKKTSGAVVTIKKKKTPEFQKDFSHNSINLLNGFKVWNYSGEDITSKFSPKRRELLILVLLFTVKEGGITSKKLSNILWPGFTPKNKKNNRSTQIKEIRKIFENQISAEITFIDKKWQFQFADSGKVDVFTLDTILPDFWSSKKRTLSEIEVIDFARIVSRGALLPQIEEEWVDAIKAEYNTRILDLLSPFLEIDTLGCTEKLEIIAAILVIDPLFETAVKKKVGCLLEEGKYGSAKKVVENYKKLYESYYNEIIDPEFLKFVK